MLFAQCWVAAEGSDVCSDAAVTGACRQFTAALLVALCCTPPGGHSCFPDATYRHSEHLVGAHHQLLTQQPYNC